jgi:pyruvate formate lyase activating enzyme
MLHPAPPESYTIFMAGCNFRCLHCQNWDIAHYPDTGASIEGLRDPVELAGEGARALSSLPGRLMGADRLFFSGGESTCSLPFVERVVSEARRLAPGIKVNFDTNGFATPESFERILALATSVTFDIRAVSDEVHRAMTGAPAAPVLRNAATMASHPGKLWEFRVLVVPDGNEEELERICTTIADLGPELPVAFLAFRPNFVLEEHHGASLQLMQRAVETARDCGLKNAEWHGHPDLPGRQAAPANQAYHSAGARMAGGYASRAGCITAPRSCGDCELQHECPVKNHRPRRRS